MSKQYVIVELDTDTKILNYKSNLKTKEEILDFLSKAVKSLNMELAIKDKYKFVVDYTKTEFPKEVTGNESQHNNIQRGLDNSKPNGTTD